MQNKTFRAPAVPLVTHDPMFSLWSFSDTLTGDCTRHWTGVRQYMFGLVTVDGVVNEFMGSVYADDARYSGCYEKMRQLSCTIRPMTTKYVFENDTITLELTFTSPLLLDDLMILSRPVTYVDYKITPKDGEKHEIHVHFGFSGELCVNDLNQKVTAGTTAHSIYLTSGTEHMLKRAGDDHRIEWGSFHVVSPSYMQNCTSLRWFQKQLDLEYGDKLQPVNPLSQQGPNREQQGPKEYSMDESYPVYPYFPTLTVRKNFEVEGDCICDGIALAYDDVKCFQYFGENVDAYWKKDGDCFTQMLYKAMCEHDEVLEKVRVFEDALLEKARTVSDKYADIVSLAYRQTVAGHKLAYHNGKILFVSKENYSNGCGATVDVTYPSIPLYLMYQPDLVEGMLNPVFELLDKGLWDCDFAPHDVGKYPLINGQIYGYKLTNRSQKLPFASQMPVEECGNMLLCVAALCFARKDMGYFVAHQKPLKQWADYLVKVGYNPENQLCTDDFAGRLAHNVNLSAKAICGLGAYAKLLTEIGDLENAAYYRQVAEGNAKLWEENAEAEECYKLTFDGEGTWSIKYNMVWDKLFELKLFSQKVYDKELAWYKKQVKAYGIPLDSRADTTKTDWELWTTRIFEDREFTDAVVDAMWNFLCDTPVRVPFTDLHFCSKAWPREFQARTVQGGLFINLLKF